jgi:hypothetical protein
MTKTNFQPPGKGVNILLVLFAAALLSIIIALAITRVTDEAHMRSDSTRIMYHGIPVDSVLKK